MIFGSLIQKDLLRKAGFAIPFASLIIIIYYIIFPKNIIQYDISEFFFKWGYHYIIPYGSKHCLRRYLTLQIIVNYTPNTS